MEWKGSDAHKWGPVRQLIAAEDKGQDAHQTHAETTLISANSGLCLLPPAPETLTKGHGALFLFVGKAIQNVLPTEGLEIGFFSQRF